MNSIRIKLFVYYVFIALIIFSILGVFLYFSLENVILRSIDNSIATKAKALATLISEDKGINFQFSDEIMKEYSINSKNYFQIFENGRSIERSLSLEGRNLVLLESPKTVNFKGEPIRAVPYTFSTNHKTFTIECAQNIDNTIDLLQTYLGFLFAGTLAAILLSALGGLIVAYTMLKPLKSISNIIDKVSELNLSNSHIDENVANELKPLTVAFNRTLKRLDNVFNKQKQFVADVSHELKTPLSIILIETEMVQRRERNVGEYKETIRQIQESATYMSHIIEKLLKLIKIENAGLIEKKAFSVGSVINKAIELLNKQIEKQIITIKKTGRDFVIEADETLILELLLNILENAIKYNKQNGTIEIAFNDTFKSIEIKDSGIGIPENSLDKIFDKFYRVDQSRSKTIEGLGLGLSLVREIVLLHNAKINIESTVGTGTKVTIEF